MSETNGYPTFFYTSFKCYVYSFLQLEKIKTTERKLVMLQTVSLSHLYLVLVLYLACCWLYFAAPCNSDQRVWQEAVYDWHKHFCASKEDEG